MLIRILANIKSSVSNSLGNIIVNGIYGYFWTFKEKVGNSNLKYQIYSQYCARSSAFDGLKFSFTGRPILPHGLNGIHISNGATIGSGVVIFQQVTIGSNTLKGHRREGSPTIGNNVYIGAGAKIIGKVTIGDNCRIGANAVVVTDMKSNSTAVAATTRIIEHVEDRDNSFVAIR